MRAVVAVLALALVASAVADIPVMCLYPQVVGKWTFSLGLNDGDRTLQCNKDFTPIATVDFELADPNVVKDTYDRQVGTWSMVDDEAFEIRLADGKKFFAFFDYKTEGDNVTSLCGQTQAGWYHDAPSGSNALPSNWGCFTAVKPGSQATNSYTLRKIADDAMWMAEDKLAAHINSVQSHWTAGSGRMHVGTAMKEMVRRAGKPKVFAGPRPGPSRTVLSAEERTARYASLPDSWDWRNVSGVNYVGPQRDQLNCGSCFAHAGTGMYEARIRIMTNNTLTTLIGPQEIVSCSSYSQGCDGGYAFLVSKYGQDFGHVSDSDFAYESGIEENVPCKRRSENAPRMLVKDYHYVGGYWGNCNADEMRLELVNNGPLSVAYFVYPDFMLYTGGIYHHVPSSLELTVNPWEPTNHEVLLVGYGTENGQDYWIVKNSWGRHFGEGGYFRIRRGSDECGIESGATWVTPAL